MIYWDPADENIIVDRPEQLALHVLPSIYHQLRNHMICWDPALDKHIIIHRPEQLAFMSCKAYKSLSQCI
jgi:hypothetical protein